MSFYWFILAALATWRISHLLQAEDGPWALSARLRPYAGNGMAGELLDCFLCLSLWVALPLALLVGDGWGERLLLWPALSAAAIMIERWTAPAHATAPAAFIEDPPSKETD